MGFFDDVIRGGADVFTLGLAEPLYFGPKDQRQSAEQQARDIRGQQITAQQQQLNLLNQMKAPQTSPEMLRRIAALEEESKDRPLSQDPYFQGNRAQLVNGGRAAVADVQNVQKGYGIDGGFKNVGSVADIQDRLGGQLAQLGQQATAHRAQSRDLAAEAREAIVDSQTAYENAVIQAKMAIAAGDSASAIEAIKAAYAAKDGENQARQRAIGQVWGTGTALVGALAAGPAGAAAGAEVGSALGSSGASPYQPNQQLFQLPNPVVNSPWAYRGFYGN